MGVIDMSWTDNLLQKKTFHKFSKYKQTNDRSRGDRPKMTFTIDRTLRLILKKNQNGR